MERDRPGDYFENMSDSTSCSCLTNSINKCSANCCDMLQEPFFLHPPGSRPRDGIYINPMSSPFISESNRSKELGSFYLHSPHDLVYTRITHLFGDNEKSCISSERSVGVEREDETLTVKVDVHINNEDCKSNGTGKPISLKSFSGKDSNNEHAYEQICVREEENDIVKTPPLTKLSDSVSDSSQSRKNDRRFSRSSNASESSNVSSEIHCYSSSTSTPPLSRNNSHERVRSTRSPKSSDSSSESKKSTASSPRVESEKDTKTVSNGFSMFRPPPPPPLPPPDVEEVVVISTKVMETISKEEKNEFGDTTMQEQKIEVSTTTFAAANKSDASCQQAEVASSPADPKEENKSCQVPHLVNKHMVLPFIPPQFANTAESNALLKPSEYLKSICKGSSGKASLSKARSVDNLDIQSRTSDGEQEEQKSEEKETVGGAGPPPPPLPPSIQKFSQTTAVPAVSTGQEQEPAKPQQPLATISIHDLTSVQLRRTSSKMHATKTMSAPPNRSVSMTNVSEAFFVQKTDLIAELKKTRDIPGIKKLKVERAKVEKSQEQTLISEINKTFNIAAFMDEIPATDSSGNVIPIWKRQMLARKAAERAKKEMEEQIARENEEKRQKAIPPWKRQLLAKKDNDDKKTNVLQTSPPAAVPVKVDVVLHTKKEPTVTPPQPPPEAPPAEEIPIKANNTGSDSDDEPQIIPWRAQLRKTNSKLNILD